MRSYVWTHLESEQTMNFNDFWKAVATITIWVISGLVALSTVMFSSGSYSWEMVGIPLIVALLATFFMWVAPILSQQDAEKARYEAEAAMYKQVGKQKRTNAPVGDSRLSLLLELMDDDERAAFKETLKRRVLAEQRLSDDGEFYGDTSLGDLLDEVDHQRNY